MVVWFEQEYSSDPETGEPLGWENGEPGPHIYCAVGAGNVIGREISDAHLYACLDLEWS